MENTDTMTVHSTNIQEKGGYKERMNVGPEGGEKALNYAAARKIRN